ncbi:MAG: hypothetical protein GXO73_10595 [Calditrichaeota bacterium]|nr:hypothetical protein [Calditrichota bacterium]
MDSWLPFVYQYGVMSVFFVLGFVLAASNHEIRWNLKSDRWTVQVLIGGFIYYMLLQGFMQFVLPKL